MEKSSIKMKENDYPWRSRHHLGIPDSPFPEDGNQIPWIQFGVTKRSDPYPVEWIELGERSR